MAATKTCQQCGGELPALSSAKRRVCAACKLRRRKTYDLDRYQPTGNGIRDYRDPAAMRRYDEEIARQKALRNAGRPKFTIGVAEAWQQVYHVPQADACEQGDAQQIRDAYREARIPSDDTFWIRGRSAQNVAFYYCTKKDKA